MDYHADFFNASGKDFLDEDPQGGLGVAVAIHQRLQGKGPLRFASGGNDCFLNVHGAIPVVV
jgi:hypothetical protein